VSGPTVFAPSADGTMWIEKQRNEGPLRTSTVALLGTAFLITIAGWLLPFALHV
jgi:hypothetical protein